MVGVVIVKADCEGTMSWTENSIISTILELYIGLFVHLKGMLCEGI